MWSDLFFALAGKCENRIGSTIQDQILKIWMLEPQGISGVFQRPLTLILLQKYRDTNGRRIVIQIGGVYTTFCQEKGILLQKYRDRSGRCIAILFKSIGVRGRRDSPEYIQEKPGGCKHGDSCRFCHCDHDAPKHKRQSWAMRATKPRTSGLQPNRVFRVLSAQQKITYTEKFVGELISSGFRKRGRRNGVASDFFPFFFRFLPFFSFLPFSFRFHFFPFLLLFSGSESFRFLPFKTGRPRFGSVTVWGWKGSSGSGFRFWRFLCKRGLSVFQYSLTGRGFGSWKNGSDGSGSTFGFRQNGSDGSGFRFRFGSWATLKRLHIPKHLWGN